MRKYIYCFLVVLCTSCSGFLDVKPDRKMAIPKTLEHAELLLNDYSSMNMGYPTYGEIGTDDYYLNTADWQSLSDMDERNTYFWSNDPIVNVSQWQNPYRTVYLSNQILSTLSDIKRNEDRSRYDKVLGAAHFFRAFAFHQLTTVFSLPYNISTAAHELGIPLRLSPDLDYRSVRSSLQETYGQIIDDYRIAVKSLPVSEPLDGRPHKAAAYAGLARLYLDMSDFNNAYRYADSALSIHAELLDYNTLNSAASLPIPRFNEEVLFPAVTTMSGPHGQFFSRIAPELYLSYDNSDLRKTLYFQHNEFDAGTYAFKGSYDNSTSGLFVGLTTSEMYLIRAETAARLGNTAQANEDLNTLLQNRIDEQLFGEVTEVDPEKLLRLVLGERRKELVFRGRRWGDLKRLNQEAGFAKTLIRNLDGKEYKLEPNSSRYAVKIPEIAITETGMEQNK